MREEIVTDWQGKIVNRSKNLAGILKFSRGKVINKILAERVEHGEGELSIHLDGGFHYRVRFASYSVLLDWLGNRRSWGGSPVRVSTWPTDFALDKRQMEVLANG